jgi:hypothetical protein
MAIIQVIAIPEAKKDLWSWRGAERVVEALAILKRITDDTHTASDASEVGNLKIS